MSQLVLYLPGNIWHSNVPADRRRDYMENFSNWLGVLRSSSIPVSTSFSKIDLELLGGIKEENFEGVDLLGAPYNHALLSVFAGHRNLGNHAKWLTHNGTSGNTEGYFVAEFDIPAKDILPRGHRILPALSSPSTILYSECMTGDVNPDHPISAYKALQFRDKTVVPMHGVEEAQKHFFFWQRYPTDANLQKFLDELHRITENDSDDILILFFDLEAPLVGSHHGLQVWQWFFEAVKSAGLSDAFIPWGEAIDYWKEVAVKPETPAMRLLSRDLGRKWTGLQPQLDHLDRIKLCRSPQNEAEQVWMSMFTTSDFLSAWDRKLRGVISFDADNGNLEIGYDQTIIDIGLTCLRAYERQESPCFALRGLGSKSEDTRWFANKCALLLEKYNL